MVTEAGYFMVQMSFYLRKEDEAGNPSGDPEVYGFMSGGKTSYENTHARAISFHAAFISCFRAWNAEMIMSAPRKGTLEGHSDFRTDSRIRFCKELVLQAEQYLARILNEFAFCAVKVVWDW